MHFCLPSIRMLVRLCAVVLLSASFAGASASACDAAGIAQASKPQKMIVAQAEGIGTPSSNPDVTKRNLFGRPSGAAQPRASTGSFSRFYVWLMRTQQKVHLALATAVKDLKSGNPVWAALVLGFLSFSYGILHAAGPGHGKAVISSYVLANERTVKRGIALSFLAAGIQGLSALVLVGILVLVMRATSMDIKTTENWVETASWGLVTLVGLWLLFRQAKSIVSGWYPGGAGAVGGSNHAHGHDHDHSGHECCGHEHHGHHGHHNDDGAQQAHLHNHDTYMHDTHKHGTHGNEAHAHDAHHHHHHHHGEECGCGHAHIPSPDQLTGPWSWPHALAIAFSVGIRPCTGAIIVLVFAISQGLMWAGVFATFAMAIGTAITVSFLAAMAVGSRDLATRLAGKESRWGWRIERTAGIGGALLVIGLGATFFMGSLQPATPF